MHGRGGDRELVKALELIGDTACAEVIVLPQIQDLGDHLRWFGPGRTVRPARPVAEPSHAPFGEATSPLVERIAGYSVVPAGTRHRARLTRVLRHLEPPMGQADLLVLGHGRLVSAVLLNLEWRARVVTQMLGIHTLPFSAIFSQSGSSGGMRLEHTKHRFSGRQSKSRPLPILTMQSRAARGIRDRGIARSGSRKAVVHVLVTLRRPIGRTSRRKLGVSATSAGGRKR